METQIPTSRSMFNQVLHWDRIGERPKKQESKFTINLKGLIEPIFPDVTHLRPFRIMFRSRNLT